MGARSVILPRQLLLVDDGGLASILIVQELMLQTSSNMSINPSAWVISGTFHSVKGLIGSQVVSNEIPPSGLILSEVGKVGFKPFITFVHCQPLFWCLHDGHPDHICVSDTRPGAIVLGI